MLFILEPHIFSIERCDDALQLSPRLFSEQLQGVGLSSFDYCLKLRISVNAPIYLERNDRFCQSKTVKGRAMNSTEPKAKAPSLLGDFVSEVELAKALGVSRRTICRNFQQDGPTRIRLGRKVVMYRRSEVLAWLQRAEVHGISTRAKSVSR